MVRSRRAVVIPAYNEEKTISKVVLSLIDRAEVIVVNDCSKDKTSTLAREAGAIVVDHLINKGYEQAINSGFTKAAELGCDFVLTFDADGQHDARLVECFFEQLESNNADLVLGVRPRPARVSEKLMAIYTRFLYNIKDPLCGMKAYKIQYFKQNQNFDRLGSIGIELALSARKQGARTAEVEVPIHPRQDSPRFGSVIKANLKIFKALIKIFYFYEIKKRV